jgi:hypothetical protein
MNPAELFSRWLVLSALLLVVGLVLACQAI